MRRTPEAAVEGQMMRFVKVSDGSAGVGARVGLLALSLFAAVSIGALSNVAMATHASGTHYHIYNSIPHGMVHGSSTTDDNWHARIESVGSNSDFRSCQAALAQFGPGGDDVIGTSYTAGINGATCNYWVAPNNPNGSDEGAGLANVGASKYGVTTLSAHAHPLNH